MTARGQKRERGREGRRPRPPLPVREIVAVAARVARRDPVRILAVALVVSVLSVLMDIVAADLIDRTDLPLRLTGALTSEVVNVLGTVLLAGFLCRILSQAEHGAGDASFLRVVRTLPWSRLIRADLLVALLFIIGALALLIPGLVVLTLFAIVGPVIEIEGRAVLAALRRSARLVWPRFWWVALFATAPLILAGEIESLAPQPHGPWSILAALAVRGVVDALVEAAIGLVLVELCYRLIALDAAPAGLARPDVAAGQQVPGAPDPCLQVGQEAIQGVPLGVDGLAQALQQGQALAGQPQPFLLAGALVLVGPADLSQPVLVAQHDRDLVQVQAEQGLQLADARHPGQVVRRIAAQPARGGAAGDDQA
ncbi:MAG TPA: hypothetical protein VMI33_12715 [Streptosporangiaceae bacterium]|nr:hypothetical protein [Streptosporangiaceae bacterium]